MKNDLFFNFREGKSSALKNKNSVEREQRVVAFY